MNISLHAKFKQKSNEDSPFQVEFACFVKSLFVILVHLQWLVDLRRRMSFIFNILLIYSRTHVIRILRGPRNLFELHDYSNYRSFHT